MAQTTKQATRRASPSERRDAILQAAAEVFFEQGFAATSIDMIIEKLGGSKRAIYAEFGNKEGLFTEIVSLCADYALSALAQSEEDQQKRIEERLLAFGRNVMQVYFTPALLGAFRTIIGEGLRFPHLARAFFEQGPGRAVDHLAEVLAQAQQNGEVQLDDPQAAASHFVGMLRDNLHLGVVLGLYPVPSAEEIEAHVISAVGILLRGIAAPKTRRRN